MASMHVTLVTRRGDRRIMGRPGARVNLCGAEPTADDVSPRDAKRCLADPAWHDRVCPACVQAMKAGG